MIKQVWTRLFAVSCLTILLAACYDMSASEPRAKLPAGDNNVPSVYLVTVSGQYSGKEIETLFVRYGVSRIQRVDTQLYQVTLTKDPGLQRLQQLVKESDMIRHIQPNYIYRKN